jgi:two-component system NtrC family sensor kinase
MGAILAIRGAKSIFQPIESMTAVVRAEQAGEHRRIGHVESRDEIGELAVQFDRMLDLLEERNNQIQRGAEDLELKVEERTSELKEKNIRLQKTIDLLRQTRKQLVMAEKLAALGELTAGVAHEINNPTAVILGNVQIVISELGENVGPVETELDLIIEQVYRIRTIVDKLLKYSRPTEYASDLESVDLNHVLEDTLLLVRHEAENKAIQIKLTSNRNFKVVINRQELQQVLVNLIVNAIHASPQGGQIHLKIRKWPSKGAIICVRDYGNGIPADQLDRIFDPFFTVNKETGTGLGLSVSYGLIRRYGGRITVNSTPGEGTRFDVYLLSKPVFTNDDETLIEQLMSVSSEA